MTPTHRPKRVRARPWFSRDHLRSSDLRSCLAPADKPPFLLLRFVHSQRFSNGPKVHARNVWEAVCVGRDAISREWRQTPLREWKIAFGTKCVKNILSRQWVFAVGSFWVRILWHVKKKMRLSNATGFFGRIGNSLPNRLGNVSVN